MQIIKKIKSELSRESAHGGEGIKKTFAGNGEVENVDGFTYSCLDAGKKFSWHNHENATEMFFVIKGSGVIREKDGEQSLAAGDFFIIPKGILHEIENTGDEKIEAIFVRVK